MAPPFPLPKRAASSRKWFLRACIAIALGWMCAHLIVAGSPSWAAESGHEAVILGQMMAVLLFPAVVLLAFGLKSKKLGIILGICACIIAALAGLVHS